LPVTILRALQLAMVHHAPVLETVTLPFLRYRRTQTIQGDPGIQLAGYLADTVTVPAATLATSQANFTLPPALQTAPAGSVYTGGYTEPVAKKK
jgi:hypothetical protein